MFNHILPSRYISRIITGKCIFIIYCSFGTQTFLWLNTIPADVKLLTVIWMSKGWMGKCSAVRPDYFTVRARKAIVQNICLRKAFIYLFITSNIYTYLFWLLYNLSFYCPGSKRRCWQYHRKWVQVDKGVRGVPHQRSWKIYHKLEGQSVGSSHLPADIPLLVVVPLLNKTKIIKVKFFCTHLVLNVVKVLRLNMRFLVQLFLV